MTPNVQPIMHITMVMHNKDTAQHHVNTKPFVFSGLCTFTGYAHGEVQGTHGRTAATKLKYFIFICL